MSDAADEGCLRRLVIEPAPEAWATPTAPLDATAPIFSGHQAQIWHPGILVKDIVALEAARRFATRAVHLVVDQDQHAVWRLDVPRREGDRLKVEAVLMAPHRAAVPTGFQAPGDADAVRQNLPRLPREAAARLGEALDAVEPQRPPTLAAQVAAITAHLAGATGTELPRVFASGLAREPRFIAFIERMVADAERCVRAYNAAAMASPSAGIRPLALGRELIELPLWACRWNRVRREVFVDVGDARHRLTFADATPIDRDAWELLPRALTMTAYVRSGSASRFVHGLGGGQYERVTQAWWLRWAGEPLAPVSVATADCVLRFEAPVADAAEWRRARWLRHHAPQNVDRLLDLDTAPARRKRALLDHMDDDRDPRRRAEAYQEVQAINRQLRDDHPEVVGDAEARLARAEAGVHNAHVAAKRDWPLPLYDPACLASLREAAQQRLASPCACG